MADIPSEAFEALLGILVGIVGWNVRRLSGQIDHLQRKMESNSGRLIRIETRLSMPDNSHDIA